MKQMNHTYTNIEREQKYVSGMLKRGYILQEIHNNRYTFEKRNIEHIVCKVVVIREDNYELIEAINAFVEKENGRKIEAWIKEENKIVIYLYAGDSRKLDFMKSDSNCIVSEYDDVISLRKKNMAFAVLFITILIVRIPWCALIELLVVLWCYIDILKCKKCIRNIKIQQNVE